jgi:hypothetical protein
MCIVRSIYVCMYSTYTMYIVFLRRVQRLLVIANVVPSLLVLVTLMMEILRSSETSALPRATRRNIPGNGILQDFSFSPFVSPKNMWLIDLH